MRDNEWRDTSPSQPWGGRGSQPDQTSSDRQTRQENPPRHWTEHLWLDIKFSLSDFSLHGTPVMIRPPAEAQRLLKYNCLVNMIISPPYEINYCDLFLFHFMERSTIKLVLYMQNKMLKNKQILVNLMLTLVLSRLLLLGNWIKHFIKQSLSFLNILVNMANLQYFKSLLFLMYSFISYPQQVQQRNIWGFFASMVNYFMTILRHILHNTQLL